jgi:hypothetical protein
MMRFEDANLVHSGGMAGAWYAYPFHGTYSDPAQPKIWVAWPTGCQFPRGPHPKKYLTLSLCLSLEGVSFVLPCTAPWPDHLVSSFLFAPPPASFCFHHAHLSTSLTCSSLSPPRACVQSAPTSHVCGHTYMLNRCMLTLERWKGR